MQLLRSDLPLDRDGAWRYLPWILAMMVYLAALAFAGALAVGDAVEGWKRGLIGQFTVQVMPAESADAGAERAARLQAVIDHLTTIAAIEQIRVLDDAATRALVEPWLGPADSALDLPLPDVIAVTARPGMALEAATIEERLANSGVETVVDDHGRWARDLVRFGRGLQLMAAIVVAIVAAAGMLVVYFVTRTGLAVHARIIEIAHLVGARDIYVARQVQRHALWLGLLGGAFGLALAGATWWALGYVFGLVSVPFLPALEPDWLRWLWIALLVPVAGLLAMLTARRTVFATLRRML
jgi:cell division transport system permease protein